MTEPELQPHRKVTAPGRPASWYADNPQARFSFSRFATHERCPGWFRHQYLRWHRTWSLPIMRAGHVVQNVLERVFDGTPAVDVTIEVLEERAFTRMTLLFDRAWEEERRTHEEDPNGHGPWELSRDRYLGYVRQGLRFHLAEVQARMAGRHPRTGVDLDLPPLADLREAWVEVRPWHAPHGVPIQEAMEVVPEGFFQGQYDLVYTWTGGRRIVDLKASAGTGPFATEIGLQLLSYAFMERALGRGLPEGLEAWFLGQDEPRVFRVPDEKSLEGFERDVCRLIERSGSEKAFGAWDPQGFAPDPAEVPDFTAPEGDASAWCATCPASFTCPKSARRAPPRGEGLPFDDDAPEGPPIVEGLVLGVGEPRERSNGKTTRRVTLANETGARSFTWSAGAVKRLVRQGLRAGRVVRIDGLRPWEHPGSGDILLYDGPDTALKVLSETWAG